MPPEVGSDVIYTYYPSGASRVDRSDSEMAGEIGGTTHYVLAGAGEEHLPAPEAADLEAFA